MDTSTVSIPRSLLLSPDLTASAKVLWLALHTGAESLSQLQNRSGLSRHTVLSGLALLKAAGWYSAEVGPINRAPEESVAVIPVALLSNRGLLPQAKLLYGVLQLTQECRSKTGQFTYRALGGFGNLSVNTLKRAVVELSQAGWLETVQEHQRAPIRYRLSNPIMARAETALFKAKERLKQPGHYGEALMREYLNLIVDSDHFQDNADPGFLVNPLTGELLQFDRYYLSGVAWEFNGPQHYGRTERYSARIAAEQRARDYIKQGICRDHGITLRIVHPEDLCLSVIQQMIGDSLPKRDLTGYEPLINYLEMVSRKYRRRMRALLDRISKGEG